MSADLNIWIPLKGTPEELLAMLVVLKKLETQSEKQSKSKSANGYIDFVHLKSKSGSKYLSQMTDEELADFVAAAGRRLSIEASGPWGVSWPRDARLFEALAAAAPAAYFNGSIYGSVSGEEIGHGGDLINGKLYLIDYTEDDDDDDDFDDDDSNGDDVEYRIYDPETNSYSEGRFEKKCNGLAFILSGDVAKSKDAEALVDYIEMHGGRIEEEVSMATRYLICNTPASVMKKHKKAVSMGMRIITEAEFFEMFGRP